MSFLHKLIPAPLRALDLRLQQDHPRLWSTRLHYHLWFLLLANLLVFALGMVVRVTPHEFPDPESLYGYLLLPAFVYFCFWVYKVVLFSAEKRFGLRKPYAEVGEFLIHLVSILLIMSIPYNLMLTVAWRIDRLVSDKQFVHDVDALNTQSYMFIGSQRRYDLGIPGYSEQPAYSMQMAEEAAQAMDEAVAEVAHGAQTREPLGSGTHEFFRNLDEYIHRKEVRGANDDWALQNLYADYIREQNNYSDTNDRENFNADTASMYRLQADSIEQHFSLYLTELARFTPEYPELPILSDSLLELRYVERLRKGEAPDVKALDEVLAIGRFYSPAIMNMTGADVVAEFNHRITSTSNIISAKDQLDKISKAKALGYYPLRVEVLIYALLITAFVLALLLSVFRNLYWQPFLITLVTAALLPVVLLLFALLTEHGIFNMDDGKIMMYSYWWIALFLLIMLAFIHRLKAYTTTRAVMTVLANVAVPFMAFFTLMILTEEFDVFGLHALQERWSELYNAVGANAENPALVVLGHQLDALRKKVELVQQGTFWGGLLLYVFILHSLFRKCYTRLMALPERK